MIINLTYKNPGKSNILSLFIKSSILLFPMYLLTGYLKQKKNRKKKWKKKWLDQRRDTIFQLLLTDCIRCVAWVIVARFLVLLCLVSRKCVNVTTIAIAMLWLKAVDVEPSSVAWVRHCRKIFQYKTMPFFNG